MAHERLGRRRAAVRRVVTADLINNGLRATTHCQLASRVTVTLVATGNVHFARIVGNVRAPAGQ